MPLLTLLLVPALTLPASPTASAQSCGIGLTATPSQVSFPFGTVPPPDKVTFSETFNVTYPSSMANETLTLEYFNGTRWRDLQNFVGNPLGFTETSYGLDSGWVRFGTTSVRVANGTCLSDTAVFSVKFDAHATVLDAAAYAGVAGAILAFLFLGRKLGWKRFLILAVPVYLALSPWTGQRYDVYFLISAGIRVLQHVNPFNPGNPPAYPGPLKWVYPPAYAFYSAFSYLVYRALTGAPLPSTSSLTWPGWLTSTYNVYEAFVPRSLPLLVALLKLPMVASAFLTGWLLTKMTGRGSTAILWIANPLVILVAAVWGQLDPIATLMAVAAVYYFQRGREYHAYLFASIGAAVKVWPALMIPIMLAISLRRGGPKAARPVVAVLPATLLTIGLYGVYGNVLDSLFVFVYARGVPTFAGAFSVNGLTWQEVLFVLKSPPVPLFLYVGIPTYAALLVWIYWKGDTDIVKWTLVSVLMLFLTYNYVNPQYFYWVLPLLLLQGRRVSYVVYTALPLAFMALAYDLFYFVSPAILLNEYAIGASIADQIKTNYFYQTEWLFILVAAAVPTMVYALSLFVQLRPRKASQAVKNV
ncbi:MAG: hypothetical protein JRM94_03085 [Nitrososphaerota archaeon]|nr:hypothetical protein [Nitrososphaerota archaeon]MDG6943045.1 hypothetical protein [Nitrososphaerota archaeon]